MATRQMPEIRRGVTEAERPRRITVLGATGSVGLSTLDLLERALGAYDIVALTANTKVDELIEVSRRHRPDVAVITDETKLDRLRAGLEGTGIEAAAGMTALREVGAREADWVMSAIVGAAGLPPTLEAIRHAPAVAIANKETLVCAGEIVMAEVAKSGARLLPVDSEHNAIFQVFDYDHVDRVEKIILTASGGPFREKSSGFMETVTPAQAVAHPNWSMGAKISVDSATMMNKGLEMIEADHLFPVGAERIDVVVHPQSVIHSMVSYVDGSVLAQMGTPDMRTPIASCLAWPDRMDTPCERLDFRTLGALTFETPDLERFPALALAQQALKSRGSAATILNAANEMAVAAFLAEGIGFLDIARIVEHCMEKISFSRLDSLEHVYAVDQEARRVADTKIAAIAG
ncbi:MAG: 1-deoxy-D-xylulose-5-phosphate reductoisomerase [Pseudomonadota bacterium]